MVEAEVEEKVSGANIDTNCGHLDSADTPPGLRSRPNPVSTNPTGPPDPTIGRSGSWRCLYI